MEVIDIDLVTVLVATIVSFIAGGIWYSSLLFGEIWKKEHKIATRKENKRLFSWISAFAISLLTAFFLALFLAFLGATSTLDGIYVGIGLWIGFILPTQLYPLIWAKSSWKLFAVDAFFWLINLVIMGAIIAA